tara:strand:- start:90 stop:221 length:132 start_codon:yes stop_codon:yes gene_type:complete
MEKKFTIKDIKKAWFKNYNIWFKEGYNLESILNELIIELNKDK